MIIPVKCFSCGMVLADKYRYYVEEVRKRKMAKDMEQLASSIQKKTREIENL